MKWLQPVRQQLEALSQAWKVPLGVAVGWIQVESGGRVGEVTSLGERGYFQLLPEESKDLHIEHERLSTDQVYSLVSGFRLITYYSARIEAFTYATGLRVQPGSEFYWRLVKLAHSIGQGACKVMMTDAAHQHIDNWAAFAAFFLEHDAEYTKRLRHSPLKWVRLVDRMFEIGRPFGVSTEPARRVVAMLPLVKKSA